LWKMDFKKLILASLLLKRLSRKFTVMVDVAVY